MKTQILLIQFKMQSRLLKPKLLNVILNLSIKFQVDTKQNGALIPSIIKKSIFQNIFIGCAWPIQYVHFTRNIM